MTATLTSKRLRPYYISRLLEGVIFWFAIEKLFMQQLGFTNAGIGLVIVMMTAMTLLSEVPLGIIADRTSRKAMAFTSLLLLASASLILGLALSPLTYTIGLLIFGLYSASSSGLDESMIYDAVLEEESSGRNYDKYFGKERLYGSIGLIIGSLGSTFVSQWWGLQATYLLTIPFVLGATVMLAFFNEPQLHKQSQEVFAATHIRQTIAQLSKSRLIIWIVISLLAIGIVDMTLLEADQFWPLALNLPVVWYGVLNAGLLACYGLGGWWARFIARKRSHKILALCLLVGGVIGLSVERLWVIVVAQLAVLLSAEALYVVYNGRLQDLVASRYRAGVSSILGSFMSIIFMPFMIGFTRLIDSRSVFDASFMLWPVVVVTLVSIVKIRRHTLAQQM